MTLKRLFPPFVLLLLLLLGICWFVKAQDAKIKPTPKITIEQQAEFQQARAELAEARLALQGAEVRYQAIVTNLQSVCPLVVNAGRPQCAPAAEKPPVPATK